MARKIINFTNLDSIPLEPRPGVMIYIEDWNALKDLTNEEERGKFVDAMMEFDSTGAVPDFEDNKVLKTVWTFVKPKLIRDQKDYSYGIWQNRYIAATRGMDKSEKPSADDWLRMVTNGHQLETKNIETKKLETKKEPETETEAGSKNLNIEAGNSNTTQSVDPEFERQREEMKKLLEGYT